jgi:hypothetical protein
MTLVFGRVSKPAADLRAWFDQSKANGVADAFQKMRGHQGAARPASDNGDRACIRFPRLHEHRAPVPLIVRNGLTNVY